jgi:hydrogenase 3 maturation protease
MSTLMARLNEVLREPTCLVGVGNPLRGDDGVGVYLARRLNRNLRAGHLRVVDAEDIPESYVFEIAASDCRNVVIIDGVMTEAEPGTLVFGRLGDFEEHAADYSTHKLSLSLCGRILEAENKPTYLLGIVALDVDFGASLTESVRIAADLLADSILRSSDEPEEVGYAN